MLPIFLSLTSPGVFIVWVATVLSLFPLSVGVGYFQVSTEYRLLCGSSVVGNLQNQSTSVTRCLGVASLARGMCGLTGEALLLVANHVIIIRYMFLLRVSGYYESPSSISKRYFVHTTNNVRAVSRVD